MAENSLSGNSISETYQSVLQLNLTANQPIMDGYGNNSSLTISPLTSVNSSININNGSVYYPDFSNNYYSNNNLVTSNGRKIIGLNPNILRNVVGNYDFFYKNINLKLPSSSSTQTVISKDGNFKMGSFMQETAITVCTLSSGIKLSPSTYTRLNLYQIEIGGDRRKILRMWVRCDGSCTFLLSSNSHSALLPISNSNFSGIIMLSANNAVNISTQSIDYHLYAKGNGKVYIQQYEYFK